MFSKNKSVFQMYFIYFVSMALFTIVRTLSSLGLFDGLNSELSSIIFTVTIQVFIMFLIPLGLYLIFHKKRGGVKNAFVSAGFRPIRTKVILIAIGLGVLAFFINMIVSTVFGGFISFFGYEAPTGAGGTTELPMFNSVITLILDLVLVAVLPAFCEEFLHRGLLLNEISRVGYKKAIVISALLFGFIHFNINQFSYAFVLGLLMGLVTVASKTIWPAIIIHFTNNALSVYLTAAKANGWFLENFYDSINSVLQSEDFLITMLTAFMFFLLIALCLIYLVFALFKETTVYNVNEAMKKVFGTSSKTNLYSPTMMEKHKILNEMLLTKSNLNLNIAQNTNPLDVILPINRNVFKPNTYDNVFLIASIILGGLVTLFTFIWGVLW